MEINANKSKVMIMNENIIINTQLKCKNTILEIVSTYEYIGSYIDASVLCSEPYDTRKKKQRNKRESTQ